MRRNWLLLAMIVLILSLIVYAWIDGGREPVHPMAESIPVPELHK